MDPEEFRSLLARVRAGDAEAAAELVRRYEPAIRRYVRLHLTDPRLRRLIDSVDVCQSVLASFFVRAAAGQFDLEEPGQLLRLLAAMARNRLLNHARDQHADRRDLRRLEGGSAALQAVAGGDPSPSHVAAGRELLEEVRRRLTPEEQALMDRRARGQDWATIAADLGGNAEALRKRLTRALDRISRELNLGEGADA